MIRNSSSKYWIILFFLVFLGMALAIPSLVYSQDEEEEENAIESVDSNEDVEPMVVGKITIPHKMDSFSESKKKLNQLYATKLTSLDFYCNCKIDFQKNQKGEFGKGSIDASSCGLQPRKNTKRATRLEWEHVVPAHAFGSSRTCWREPICEKSGIFYKGRKCCTRVDPVYRAMEADMHNLQPSAGELNADRGNYSFGIIPGEPRAYGSCDFEVDFNERVAEPREEIRGDIARTYFYMEKTYGVKISDTRRRILEAWDKQDPPSALEIERNIWIQKIQGNKNPFIPDP